MTWLRADAAGATLTLHIQPGAKKTEVVGVHGAALKIRLHAPPVDGKANAHLLEFLAARLMVSKTAVTLLGGETSHAKRVHIAGVDATYVRVRLSGVN